MKRRPRLRAAERGSITPLVIGFAVVVLMLVTVVVDASAAYLRREGLNALADAAALAATDGLQGEAAYRNGLDERVAIDPVAARRYVREYLAAADLHQYPALVWTVSIQGPAVVVRLRSTMDLPLRLPGAGDEVPVTGSAAAVVAIAP